MSGRYEPLTAALRGAAERGQVVVEFTLDDVAKLVGGLPDSAWRLRQWWANSSHVQAQAWADAGFHVARVELDRGRVRFVCAERTRSTGALLADSTALGRTEEPATPVERLPVGAPVDVGVAFQWSNAGVVDIDRGGKPVFANLEPVPGLYRLTLTGGGAGPRPQVYIGETDNLRRRLASNYRSPGPTQQTSLRVNELLCEHLTAGGRVHLAVATAATVRVNGGVEHALDLRRKAGRLLAESAALVLAQVNADADIVNLG